MAKLIPLSVLFGDPDRVSPSISPDGAHLVWLAPTDGALNLHVDGRPVTHSRRTITSYRWSRSGRYLWWAGDDNGDENEGRTARH